MTAQEEVTLKNAHLAVCLECEALTRQRDELLSALETVVAECDGPGRPYSCDSYLPPKFIAAAREAIAHVRGAA